MKEEEDSSDESKAALKDSLRLSIRDGFKLSSQLYEKLSIEIGLDVSTNAILEGRDCFLFAKIQKGRL